MQVKFGFHYKLFSTSCFHLLYDVCYARVDYTCTVDQALMIEFFIKD